MRILTTLGEELPERTGLKEVYDKYKEEDHTVYLFFDGS
jgi:hypothetical protein